MQDILKPWTCFLHGKMWCAKLHKIISHVSKVHLLSMLLSMWDSNINVKVLHAMQMFLREIVSVQIYFSWFSIKRSTHNYLQMYGIMCLTWAQEMTSSPLAIKQLIKGYDLQKEVNFKKSGPLYGAKMKLHNTYKQKKKGQNTTSITF